MRTSMLAVAVVLSLTFLVIADDHPTPADLKALPEATSTPSQSQLLSQRIVELEKRVAMLEARIAALPAYGLPQGPVAPPATAPYPHTAPVPAPPARPESRPPYTPSYPPSSPPYPPSNPLYPPPRENESVPDTWQRFEFNGQFFYIIPVDASSQQSGQVERNKGPQSPN